MKKFIRLFLIVVATVAVLMVLMYAYYGGFGAVVVRTETQGGECMVYEVVKGDYSQAAAVRERIRKVLQKDYKLETFRGVGIFYDNPRHVEKKELRSEAGCILELADTTRIGELQGRYKVKTLPVKQYMIAEFPYKGESSIIVGILKTYPAFQKYAGQQGYADHGAVTEVYDVVGGKIIYRKEIQKAP